MADKSRVYVAGEEGSPLPSVTGKPVRIEEIRQTHNPDKLWEDPEFPAVSESIGQTGGDVAVQQGITPPKLWARPHEICKTLGVDKPDFATVQDSFSESACSANDIVQGSISNCWYVAAVQALCSKPAVLDWVIPADNFKGFDPDQYCGAFHFRFYILSHAKWLDVVVDDRIPVKDDGKPAFANVQTPREKEHAEFWVALIEKAYAKIHGSYAALDMGMITHALEDFSGGFAEYIIMSKPSPRNLTGQVALDAFLNPEKVIKNMLLSIGKQEVFMGLGSFGPGTPGYESDGYKKYGLVGPHVYTIMGLEEVKLKNPTADEETKVMVHIKNPHGGNEWTGPFSDKDDESWATLELDLRARDATGSTDIDEGAFWMELSDMMKYFITLQLCYYNITDSTKLAIRRDSWPAELQTLTEPPGVDELKQYIIYKFQVKMGPSAEAYVEKSQGKAILFFFTLVIDGYNSLYKLTPKCVATLYKMESADEPLEDVLKRDPLREEVSVAREAGTWLMVDPGWYVMVPRLYTGQLPGGQHPFPSALQGKPIAYALRIFTEVECNLEEIPPKK